MIEKINANTSRIQQLESSVRVSVDGLPALTGNLIVERPRRMRLKAGVLGLSDLGVDIGSNDTEFWIWSKSSLGGQSPAIYFASHADYARSSARQAMRLEPQWVIDALGLISLDPNQNIEGPRSRPDGHLEIVIHDTTTFRKVVIEPRYGWILRQSIYDKGGNLVAYTDSVKHVYDSEYQANLPRHVKIVVLGQNQQTMSLTVDLTSYAINSAFFDPENTWRRPDPQDIRQIDIATLGGP